MVIYDLFFNFIIIFYSHKLINNTIFIDIKFTIFIDIKFTKNHLFSKYYFILCMILQI